MGRYPKDVFSLKELLALPVSECTCEACVSRCSVMPGWMLPQDVEPIAEFLKVSVHECFERFLMIEYWYDMHLGHGNIHVLLPATEYRRGQTARFSDPFTHSPCIFLTDDKRCSIHPVKPFECRTAIHGEDRIVRSKDTHKSVAWAWLRHTEELYTMIGGCNE